MTDGTEHPHGSGTVDVLRRGWRASPELRSGAALTLVLALAGAVGRVAVPVLVQQMLDDGLAPGSPASRLWALGGTGAAVVLLTGLAAGAMRARLVRAGEAALYGLRVRAFRHIHRLSLSTQTDERRGALVSRVTSDVETLSHFLTWGGIVWLVNSAVMLTVLAVMAAYDWRLTLVAVSVVFPMGAVLRAVQGRLTDAYSRLRERIADMSIVISEVVLGISTVRAYGAEAALRKRAGDTISGSRDAGIRAGMIGAFLFPTGDIFSVLSVAAVLTTGMLLGPAQGLTAGELVAFVFLVLLFLDPVNEFTEVVDETQMAVAGWRRVLDVLDVPVDVPDPEPGVPLPPGPPEVVVDTVSFRYGGSRAAAVLHDVSFTIPSGARVAIVGVTGSGKTTLAKLLTRLADPTAGRTTVGGVDLRHVAPAALRSSLVLVPQEGFLFDTTVLDNVRFGRPRSTVDDVRLAFVELGLEAWVDGLPAGLETAVGQRGEQLSVGERQLVSLARAYVANPTCLILDEATSAVDPATEVRLSRAVESLSRGRTTITIAHRLSTAERADHVLVLDGGRLAEQGTHAELVRAGGVYASLFARWSEGIRTRAPSG